MTAQLVTLGEAMAVLATPGIGLLRQSRSLDLRVAGAEANVAIGAARLGVPSAWIGRLGDDEFGALVRQTLAGQQVDVSGVRTDPAAPTGLMVKERRTSTVTRVTYRRAGSAGSRLSAADLDHDVLDNAEILHVTGITPALSASAREAVHAAVEGAREAGVLVSVDVNHRERLWSGAEAAAEYRWLAERADILFVTEAEARLLVDGDDAPALASALTALGTHEVLVKRGGDGAIAMIEGELVDVPLFEVATLDPVGAGDAFASGYLVERIRGAEPAQRVRTAAAAGAFAVTVDGDWEGLPTYAELDLLTSADVHR
ncbi:sugar kinase [Pseudonocardia sp. TRM90224]|uniref:sugar kinase n=1 Tax=Pseudonocardia sp. TRM90224 TaxID=2812678 RepID=UPI001E31EF34|nr:sugar kinase [Pseudonocardia sp. TRM90224]